LAIRRATEELKASESLQQICRVLTAAFEANDFDAFELRTQFASASTAAGFRLLEMEDVPHLCWRKNGSLSGSNTGSTWSMSLDLVSTGNHSCGSLRLFRRYTARGLQLDINLLTSTFATTLADALHRTTIQNLEFIPSPQTTGLLSAQVS
jgi:hypothetical protein